MAAVAESIDEPRKPPRIGLLDTLRGIALLAMASYHGTWDFEFFGYLDPGTAETGWLKIYARVIASTFLFMAGVSLVLANRPAIRWQPFWKRLAMIAVAAIAISVVTRFAMPDEWIYFGILHSIAALSLIGIGFLCLPTACIWAATAVLGVGWVVNVFVMPGALGSDLFNPRYLAWLGFATMPVRSNDFVPLFPWALAFFAGLSAATLALRTSLPQRLASLGTGNSLLAKGGRHSLLFYLLHQPILFGLVYLLSLVAPAPKPDPAVGYLRQCQATCTQSAGEALCRSFCQCTLTRMKAQSLFEPLQSGAIQADQNDQIQRIAVQCTEQAQ
ncbi:MULTISPECIES: heparan-alpha-glucosaminide N-acetyltransferase [unclassified Rhizobium]|uniref:heparan-alpha-glucosaminide N-acetyltransferase n=1 Tax=unclassified Rhizobium TaxID=2613769 RepID=UPI001ADC4B8C|nr:MULTISPECIES: DUF1624 domain-containing protein [unclassified Rhizobium]MBO9098486.1 DUF1624 domain-containing protein [Rhizobium sp. L58/93]MBO9132710.1 DUF1624 domain-containing protein [Rhizobium sp. B209b/85]MBO9168752.1 DUF1624 domain-containing protein [Rhizobium sp. L245/93]QXZ84881.1 DUF1624 domain-containing protein [Rhizobium sp. K1/93]QXZ90980.1 DUF1624 domain-containing protein [Rhizobium sp. K15/93]